MQGYELDIPNDIHRRNLIKDSRFYNLKHLTESLVPATLYHNPFRGNAEEILLSILDFRPAHARIGWVEGQPFGWMEYKRPHDIDKTSKDLLVQIDDDGLIVGGGKIMLINRERVDVVKCLKETAEGRKSETHAPHVLGGRQEFAIRIEIPNECYIVVDGEECIECPLSDVKRPAPTTTVPENGEAIAEQGEGSALKKRKLSEVGEERPTTTETRPRILTLKRSIWRVKVKGQPPPASPGGGPSQPPKPPIAGGRRTLVLVAIKLEGWTKEKEFSKEMKWL
jgi:hypothetical protein